MKSICPKCHRKKKRHVYAQHVKACVPGARDMEHYTASKGAIEKTKALQRAGKS